MIRLGNIQEDFEDKMLNNSIFFPELTTKLANVSLRDSEDG